MEKYQKVLWNNLQDLLREGSIYKYSNIENGILCIENSTLYFKSPLDFYDKFDCNPSLISPSDSYIKRTLKEDGNLDEVSMRTHPKQYSSMRKMLYDDLKSMLLPKMKITCFSKMNDRRRMWDEYGASHTGVCIEFNVNELIKCLPDAFRENVTNGGYFLAVDYSKDIKRFSYNKNGDYETLLKWTKVKTLNYAHEDEIRFVLPNWNGNTFKISPKVIQAVYLGEKISKANEALIRELLEINFKNSNIIKMHSTDLVD